MKSRFIQLALLSLLVQSSAFLFLVCNGSAEDEGHMLTAVAAFNHTKAKTVGLRACAILHDNNIFSAAGGSRQYTLCVEPEQAEKARRLLAQAILAEGLDLHLLILEKGLLVIVTPESILKPPAKR